MRGIRKLPSGKYQARYFAGFDSTGKKIYPSKSFSKQADAIRWRTGKLHEKGSTLLAESLGLTVRDYLARWVEIMKQRTRPNTQHYMNSALRLYVNPTLGDVPLRNLQGVHIEQWQTELLRKVSPRTVRDTRTLLSGALDKAVRLQLIASNVIKQTDPPKVQRHEMKVFDRDEAVRFLDACPDDGWGLFFTVMLNTGIRPEEGEGLKWSSLELEGREGRLKVERVLITLGVKRWELFPPKTAHSRRTITFPASLVARFQEHRRRQLEERMAAGSAYENHGFVFANPLGEPLKRYALYRRFKTILKRSGLKDIRLYDLRHSFVTLSLLANINLKTVSADAGHASVAFTLDHYSHVLESMRESAASAREEMFGKANARGRK